MHTLKALSLAAFKRRYGVTQADVNGLTTAKRIFHKEPQ